MSNGETVGADGALTGRKLFVSYTSEDREAVVKLHDRLEDHGAQVFVDQRDIRPGHDWRRAIREGLRATQATLVALTRASTTRDSEWVDFELAQSRRLCRPLIPLLLEPVEVPVELRDLQFASFLEDWEAGLRRVVEEVERFGRRRGEQISDERPPMGRPFVGRESQVQEVVRRLLEKPRNIETAKRSLAIQAMGGMGKSMLAAEVVRRLAVLFPGGVLYVDRGKGAGDAQSILQRWLHKIDGHYPEREVEPEEVRDRLSRYGELLVLIDDVGESDFGQTQVLLDSLPPDATRLLTTRSRKIKPDLGCGLYRLDRLTDDDGLDLLRDRLGELAEEADESLLRRAVERLDGHPLSLELFAARCDDESDLPYLLDEMEDMLETGEVGLEALEVEEEEETNKYRSVAASLALSFAGLVRIDDRCGGDLCPRFVALGILPGGGFFDEALAGAVWGLDPSYKEVERSVRRALDVFVRRAMLTFDRDTRRYLLHPLMRAFVHSRLQEEPDRYRQVRFRYIRHVNERARGVYRGPQEGWKAFEFLERHLYYVGLGLIRRVPEAVGEELETLAEPERSVAVNRRPAHVEWLCLGSDFTYAVRELVIRRPELGDQGRACLQIGLACARLLGRDMETVRYLRELGRWDLRREPERAERYLAAAVRQASRRRADDGFESQKAIALSYLGEALRATSRPNEASEALRRALEIHRRLGDRFMIATTLKYLGEVHWGCGDLEPARRCYEEAQEIFEGMDLRAQQADILSKVGSVFFNAGEQRRAIPKFEEALEIHREVGNLPMVTEDLNDLGISHKYLGKLPEAEAYLQESLATARRIAYGRMEAITLGNLANLHWERGNVRASEEAAREALTRAEAIHDTKTQGWALMWVGLAHRAAGRHSEAARAFSDGLSRCESAEDCRSQAGHHVALGCLHAECLGDPGTAADHFRQAVRLLEEKDLTQAYGGRRIEEIRELLQSVES